MTAAERAAKVADLIRDFVEISADWEADGPDSRASIHWMVERCRTELQSIKDQLPISPRS
jgi:uncharacterized membrane protein YccC